MACLSRAACVGAAFLPAASLRHGCARKLLHAQAKPLGAGRAAAAAGTSPLAEPTPKFAALPAEQQRQVDAYLDLLLDWNQRMNLTAIRDREEAYERHVNDSLALLPVLDRCVAAQQRAGVGSQPATRASSDAWERGGRPPSSSSGSSGDGRAPKPAGAGAAGAAAAAARLIDVGSGAGLPGLILAIARPEWEVTLLDSLQKRCKFVEAAVAEAGLANVRVHWGRAEDAGQNPALRQQHDVAIARAVAELRVLAELCLPLVRPGGHWVSAKGAAPAAEVAAAHPAVGRLGGKLLGVEEVDSESPEGRRTAVVVFKARGTPPQFPRKPGVPGKKPL